LTRQNISAVSNKINTTDEATLGILTDVEEKTQLVMMDTPGVVKTSNSMRSNLLVSRAWQYVQE
jgi:GTPase Era involved in 16S rRNA processing